MRRRRRLPRPNRTREPHSKTFIARVEKPTRAIAIILLNMSVATRRASEGASFNAVVLVPHPNSNAASSPSFWIS
jgi:hypothetical protein